MPFDSPAGLLLALAETTASPDAAAGLTTLFSAQAVIALLTLTAIEIVLGIDSVIIALGVTHFSAHSISSFVERHSTVNMPALSFLLPVGVELLNMRIRRGQHVELKGCNAAEL